MLDHVDYRAIGVGTARATLDCRRKKALDLREVGDFCSDLLKVASGDLPYFGALGIAGTAKLDDRADLVWREAKPPSATNEGERADVPFIVDAVPAFRPFRCRENADPFEVADGFDVDAGSARQLAARDRPFTCSAHVVFP